MISQCPLCNKLIEGSSINKRETSLLRSTYKIYSSLLIPIPFVGSYFGSKVYDIFSSSNEWYYRFLCHECMCSWCSIPKNDDVKIGGNSSLLTFFSDNSFIIGSVENDDFIIQSIDHGNKKTTVISPDESQRVYINGSSEVGYSNFKQIKLIDGIYVGEVLNEIPNGRGIKFMKNGFMWYGKWINGEKNGIGFECDFDGKSYRVGYWRNSVFLK